jgi:hypothetical protein
VNIESATSSQVLFRRRRAQVLRRVHTAPRIRVLLPGRGDQLHAARRNRSRGVLFVLGRGHQRVECIAAKLLRENDICFQCLPYVCLEPVVVKGSSLVHKVAPKRRSLT